MFLWVYNTACPSGFKRFLLFEFTVTIPTILKQYFSRGQIESILLHSQNCLKSWPHLVPFVVRSWFSCVDFVFIYLFIFSGDCNCLSLSLLFFSFFFYNVLTLFWHYCTESYFSRMPPSRVFCLSNSYWMDCFRVLSQGFLSAFWVGATQSHCFLEGMCISFLFLP